MYHHKNNFTSNHFSRSLYKRESGPPPSSEFYIGRKGPGEDGEKLKKPREGWDIPESDAELLEALREAGTPGFEDESKGESTQTDAIADFDDIVIPEAEAETQRPSAVQVAENSSILEQNTEPQRNVSYGGQELPPIQQSPPQVRKGKKWYNPTTWFRS